MVDDAASCEENCDSDDKASTDKSKGSTQVEMACMKNGVLTRFYDSTKYSGAPDVGLPFGCLTVNYQVHAKAQEGLVCPKESLCRL